MLIKIRTKLGKIKIILFFTKLKWRTGYSLNIVIFPKFSKPLPHQHSAAIGCTKNYQSIGVTVHSHCVEHFECLLQRCRRGRGCSELWKKKSWTPCRSPSLPGCRLRGRLEDSEDPVCFCEQGAVHKRETGSNSKS